MASAFSLGLSFEWCWWVPAAWGLSVWTLCRGVVVALGRNFRLLSVGGFWTSVNHFVRDKSKSLSSDPWLVQLLGASFLLFLLVLETITKSQPRLHWILQPSSSTSNFTPKFFMKKIKFSSLPYLVCDVLLEDMWGSCPEASSLCLLSQILFYMN